jgi:hypothetical protein
MLGIAHKGEAPQFAARQVLALRDSSDWDGFNLWRRSATAVMEWERLDRTPMN